jgi:chromosomal replication initiation ATPase DnaA
MASSQLPLPLPHAPQYDRDSFLSAPSNDAALRLLERWPDWPARIVLLSGPAGSGKTHLAHIWAVRSEATVIRAAELDAVAPPGAPGTRALVVEDIAAGSVPEQPLFHLMNSAREVGASLLITSRLPAPDWCVGLPDLRSRLRMAAPVALDAPDESLLRKVLVKLFADRQLTVDKAVIDYLLLRMERSLNAAVELVEALDQEALAAGRRITRPLAARILSETAGAGAKFTETE